MTEAFYEPLGEGRFASTKHTVGPWTPEHQHLGPPSALLARELELLPAGYPTGIARITVEILGPVPVAELTVSAQVTRPGRSVELLSAELSHGDRVVARASAWRIAHSDTTAVAAGAPAALPPRAEVTGSGVPEEWDVGYLNAMEWCFLRGGLTEPGPAAAWVRQRVDLVAGERPSGLQRLFAVADSGNGISGRLDLRHWWFINTELTVHIHREPAGEWIGLDANTVIGPTGIGIAHSVLHDESGPVARGTQSLLIRPR